MPGLLAIVLLIVPLVELWLILQIAQEIGVWETVASLIAVAVLGTWLLTREGKATWIRLRAAVAKGEVPTTELTEGAAILVGGALLLTPGFLTDLIGLWLIFPVTRAIATRGLRRGFKWWVARRLGGDGPSGRIVYETHASDVRRKSAVTPDPPAPSARTLPSSQRPGDEGGSPDKG